MILHNKPRFFTLFFALALSWASTLHAATKPLKVLCFGDSITAGSHINDSFVLKNSWVNLLEARSGGTLQCINAGRSGRKTSGKQQLIPVMKKNPKVDIVILFLGVNDLRNSKQAVLEQCVTNTQWMIDKVKANYGAQIKLIVLSSPGIVPEVMSKHFYNMGYNEKEQVMLNKLRPLYKALAKKNDCLFIDLWGVVTSKYYHEGLHPELPGQAQIAEAVWNGYIKQRTH